MGRQIGDQASLFYEFRLDERIPKEHLLRRINLFLTPVLGGMHEQLATYYSEIGRPSIDPELMVQMLIVIRRPRVTLPSAGRSIAWLADGRRDPKPINKQARAARHDREKLLNEVRESL